MYDRTGLITKSTLIKTGFKNLRTGTKAKFRPFVDAVVPNQKNFKHRRLIHLTTTATYWSNQIWMWYYVSLESSDTHPLRRKGHAGLNFCCNTSVERTGETLKI